MPHYGWTVVGISFFVIVATAGVRSAAGVLIVPLEAEFCWSRATVSLAIGVNLLLCGAVGPFAAAAMDGFGARADDAGVADRGRDRRRAERGNASAPANVLLCSEINHDSSACRSS